MTGLFTPHSEGEMHDLCHGAGPVVSMRSAFRVLNVAWLLCTLVGLRAEAMGSTRDEAIV